MNSVHKGDEIIRLRTEVERLREALVALLQDEGAADDITSVRKQARAALAKDS